MNLQELRNDTPACRNINHLNNAGTALSPTPVAQTVFDYLDLEQRIGGYEAELLKHQELDRVYAQVAELVGAKANEIAITQNATRAWDMVFYSIPLQRGDKILTCRSEYASNYLAFLHRQRATGVEIVVLENDSSGSVCPESLKRNLCQRTKLVAINHIPTNGGLIQPAEDLGELLLEHPAFYLLDACQSVGQVPIDVKKIGCDALTATARKYLGGPRGIGFLFVAERHIKSLEPPMIDLHAATWTAPGEYRFRNDAKRFETYEVFVAGKLGLGVAADYARKVGVGNGFRRLSSLARKAREGLAEIPGIQVHDLGTRKGGIVTFTVKGLAPGQVRERLHSERINIWTCTVRSARLDMEARNLEEIARASFHYYNSEEEVEQFLQKVRELTP